MLKYIGNRHIVSALAAIISMAIICCAGAQTPDPALPPPSLAPTVAEQISVIERLAAHHRNQWNDVQRWKGRLEVADNECYFGARRNQFVADLGRSSDELPAEMKKFVRGTVEFSLDLQANALCSRFTTEAVGIVDLSSGADTGIRSVPFEQIAIVTPSEYIHFEPGVRYAQPDAKRARVAFRDHPGEARQQQLGTLVDPRALMGYGRPTWENLQILADALRAEGALRVGDAELTVSTNATETVIVMPGRAGGDRVVFQQMNFVADNLVGLSMYDANGRVYHRLKWSYPEGDAPTRPEAVEFQAMNSDGSRITFQRTLRVVHSTVNADIRAATFSRVNLGLAEDDLYVDRIAGTMSRLTDGELVALPAAQASVWLAAE